MAVENSSEFPGSPVVKTFTVEGPSMMEGELRSHKPCSTAKKKRKFYLQRSRLFLGKADSHPNPNVDTIIFPRPNDDALDHVAALTNGHYRYDRVNT